ncbi:hypothetical protein DRJ17_03955 [Candidatus Woesearchaeota archaeon]|nr:MAG: hypothetical protein DRJ17_03955 [Candidatus Woesearchaeota archaeon]
MPKKTKKIIRKRKKVWYGILAPKLFNETHIGETYTSEINSVLGRHVKVNLANLTRNIKNQNINMLLKINDFRDNLFRTDVIGYEIIPTAIKKMVRRKRDKIDDSFICVTNDAVKIRIKPFLITRNKAYRSVRTALRKATREFLEKITAKKSYEEFVKFVVDHKLQSELGKSLHKITPVKNSEIRMFKIVSKKTVIAEKSEEKEKAEVKEEKKEEKREEKNEKKMVKLQSKKDEGSLGQSKIQGKKTEKEEESEKLEEHEIGLKESKVVKKEKKQKKKIESESAKNSKIEGE